MQEAPEEAEVLYEEGLFYFDETRKWRERYVVVRANYCLECHDGLEVSGTTEQQTPLGRADDTSQLLSYPLFFFCGVSSEFS